MCFFFFTAYPPLPVTQSPHTTRAPVPDTTQAPPSSHPEDTNIVNPAPQSSSNATSKSKEKLPFGKLHPMSS